MHLRSRHLTEIIKKRGKIFPLVGVLGARQTGKSTLLRDIIAKPQSIPYVTLDRPEVLRELRANPESFILTQTNEFSTPLIIDEAHKAPGVFDVLKVLADERKTRGIVTITGSVDFSSVAGVRETLTGRIGITRLYPLTIAEIAKRRFSTIWRNPRLVDGNDSRFEHKATNAEINAWLARGGMPAICKLNQTQEREILIEEWLQAVCYRDLMQLKGARYNGALAREILHVTAKDPNLSQAEIARELGEDSRTIGKHLAGLEALFVLTRVKPLKTMGGTGFDRFFILDGGMAAYLGASKKTLYTTLMINEILAQHEYGGLGKVDLYSYATRGRVKIDLLVKSQRDLIPLVISEKSTVDTYTLRGLRALISTNKFKRISILAPVSQMLAIDQGITVVPYQNLC